MTSTLKSDVLTSKTTNGDLTISGDGSGVPNLEAGFKVGGTVGVPAGSIRDDAVTTAKINDDAVTLAKMAAAVDGVVISYDASGNPVHVGPGTDGQVLTSTGAGSPPAFEDAGGGGGLQSVQVFTSSGTWTKPAGISSVRVQLVGSGCGGFNWNKSGGAGGYSEKFIDVSSIASETVTVGAGAASGVAGNTSSFGSHCSGAGGGIPPGSAGSRTLGGLGGTATGGDINIQGAGGGGRSTGTESADGAPSYFGGGPASVVTNPASPNNVTNGAYGSSGGSTANGYTAMPASRSGIVIVWEYA